MNLATIHMVTAGVGWGTDQSGVVHTSDGGRTWRRAGPAVASSGYSAGFLPLDVIDGQVAWLATPNSFGPHWPTAVNLWRTADAGRHWQRLGAIRDSGMPGQLDFADARHGWLVVGRGAAAGSIAFDMYSTSDGGRRWTRLISNTPGQRSRNGLPDCDCSQTYTFNTPSSGWATGCYCGLGPNAPFFFHSSDGGRLWRPQPLARPSRFRADAVAIGPPIFVTPRRAVLPVYYLGRHGVFLDVYHASDAGRTWTGTTPVAVGRQNLPGGFADLRHGFFLDGRRLLRTSDGGRHWQIVPTRLSSNATDQLQFVGPRAGFALTSIGGSGRTRLLESTDAGRSWTVVPAHPGG